MLIDKEELITALEEFADTLTVIGGSYIRSAVNIVVKPFKEAESKGKVEVIHCEHCRHHENDSSSDSHWCFVWETFTDNHVYCSYAERRQE